MDKLVDEKRVEQITRFLNSLDINSKRFIEILNKKDRFIIHTFNEALTHSSANKMFNYEKLEFFGDAVLRLSASEFIERTYSNMGVGRRSELRSHIVSDEWLTEFGKKIFIEELIIKGAKAIGDENAKDTIIAESSEALIGAIYKCFDSMAEVNILLDNFWKKDAELYLRAPHKYNAKSALQEWCQSQGFDLPIYKIYEISQNHGDPKRFSCEIYINGSKQVNSFGHSHKKAQKNAARILIEKIFQREKS